VYIRYFIYITRLDELLSNYDPNWVLGIG
jgi:hypothetical protein